MENSSHKILSESGEQFCKDRVSSWRHGLSILHAAIHLVHFVQRAGEWNETKIKEKLRANSYVCIIIKTSVLWLSA
jgi:hypothetical protein